MKKGNKQLINNQSFSISNIKPFDLLSNNQIKLLEKENTFYICTKGYVLFKEGTRLSHIYLLLSGICKTFITGFEGKEQIIRFKKKSNLVGLNSLINDDISEVGCSIIHDAVICQISGDEFLKTLQHNAAFAFEVMKEECKERCETNIFLTDIAQKSVKERLAEILIYLYKSFGITSEGFLNISLSREEIANLVGTATESIIRLLSQFKNENLIEIHGRNIKLLNPTKLERIGHVYF